MSIPYGYYIAPNGHVAIDQEKANIVRMIYQQYLSGMSLGGIADFLFKKDIPSPKGRDRWAQPVLSNLLSNQKYNGYTGDQFKYHNEPLKNDVPVYIGPMTDYYRLFEIGPGGSHEHFGLDGQWFNYRELKDWYNTILEYMK